MTDFKNPKRMSGSRREWANPLGFRTVQGLATAVLLMASSAAVDAEIIYVNGSIPVSASGDGTSWATSYKFLRDALNNSVAGDDVYITKGIYFPDDSVIEPAIKGDRMVSFNLNGVNLYGGFDVNITNPAARAPDPIPNVKPPVEFLDNARTILSGAIFPGISRESEWSLHVIRMTANSTIDGVTVQNGNASGREISNNQGGGCLNAEGTTLTLNKTEFRKNKALDSGGAIWGNVVATESRFAENSVNPDPVYNYNASGGAIKGRVVVKDSRFTANSVNSKSLALAATTALSPGGNTEADGGAISGDVTATNCEFDLNSANANSLGASLNHTATARGGAISGVVRASKCKFTSNKAAGTGSLYVSYGGAIAGKFTLESCVFVANNTTACAPETSSSTSPPDIILGGGGALSAVLVSGVPDRQKSQINNSLFNENTSQLRGGAIHSTRGTEVIIQQSTFIDNGVVGAVAKGSAVSCGGKVAFLNNIFTYGVTPSVASGAVTLTFKRDNFIAVLGLGAIRNSGVEYSTAANVAKNLLSPGLPYVPITFPSAIIFINGIPSNSSLGPYFTLDVGADVPPGEITNSFFGGDAGFEGLTSPPASGVSAKLEGVDNTWGTADDRARLKETSAAVDRGQLGYMALDTLDIDGDGNLTEVVPADLAGFTRIQQSLAVLKPDLGAYEFGASTHAPEIQITPVEPAGAPTLVDNFFPAINFSAFPEVAKTYEIKNLGPANLNRLVVTITGASTGDYVITPPAITTLLPNGSATFSIKFTPKSYGPREATISVRSDDADESPFEINVSGSSLQPELNIQDPLGTNLITGTTEVDFGSVGDFGNASKVFTITNPGTKILTLQGVTVDGPNAGDFIVSGPGSTSVAKEGGSTTFTITFKPAAGGAKNARFVIISDDGDENPFQINMKGSAPLPEIKVEQPGGVDVVDGSSTIDYGKTGYLATTVKVFTIRNIGLGHLTLPSIVSSGPSASDFVVSSPVSSVVLPGGSTTFTVRYRPSVNGPRNAQITIVNDDPDAENPFTFAVTGNSLVSSRIAIRQPYAADLVDGGFSSFGTVRKGLLYTKKFIIRNDGNGVLKGISVKMTGAKSFTHTIPSATVLNTGESVSFKVTFKPKTAGVMTANLQVTSNDLDFSPFDIALSGKGVVKKRKKSMASEAMTLATTGAGKGGEVSVTPSSQGPKYLVLTLAKSENSTVTANDVEVSSNLVDWYSGEDFTKTLTNSNSLLEVRDGVPITAGKKRYIRLKPTAK